MRSEREFGLEVPEEGAEVVLGFPGPEDLIQPSASSWRRAARTVTGEASQSRERAMTPGMGPARLPRRMRSLRCEATWSLAVMRRRG